MKDRKSIVTFYATGSNTVVPAALADCVPFYGMAQDRKTRIVAGFIKAGERFSSVADPKWPEGGEGSIRKIREFECRSAEELEVHLTAKGFAAYEDQTPETSEWKDVCAKVVSLQKENDDLKADLKNIRTILGRALR